jgi:protein O-GlcNAc transferase
MIHWQSQLTVAQDHANFGRNTSFLDICDNLIKEYAADKTLILKVCSLYLGFGFPSYARQCLLKTLTLFPGDADLLLTLANAQLQLGHLKQCQDIYQDLLERFPNNCQVLRNLFFFSEYIPSTSNRERLELAKKWANLTVKNAKGPYVRPAVKYLPGKKIKLGYVSADFCQHTVGILIKNILEKHNTDQFEVFCYSSGTIQDFITNLIRQYAHFIEVAQLSDYELANRIGSDGIDILIDLSGHTGGSRLGAFAYRPAPLQLSWFGYYATTGLEYIDAVLLDDWHTHEHITDQFVEPITSLPMGRWCYFPAVDPAPLITDAPVIENGYITFGSFNNTLKYNTPVYESWSKILLKVPNSKLILKWRTFNDPEFKQHVMNQFHDFGIDPSRIELREPSFHIYMLAQYNDIDIALDPFPFSGGVTSCEALYMGVPVITWPQDRVVSRQTYAFLSNIGHPELVAQDEETYIQKAVVLANNPKKIAQYRLSLREEMLTSPLMATKDFTKSLEVALTDLFNKAKSFQP